MLRDMGSATAIVSTSAANRPRAFSIPSSALMGARVCRRRMRAGAHVLNCCVHWLPLVQYTEESRWSLRSSSEARIRKWVAWRWGCTLPSSHCTVHLRSFNERLAAPCSALLRRNEGTRRYTKQESSCVLCHNTFPCFHKANTLTLWSVAPRQRRSST